MPWPTKSLHDRKPSGLDTLLHRRAYIAQASPLDEPHQSPACKRFFRHAQQPRRLRIDLAHRNRNGRVAAIPVDKNPKVQRDNIAIFQRPALETEFRAPLRCSPKRTVRTDNRRSPRKAALLPCSLIRAAAIFSRSMVVMPGLTLPRNTSRISRVAMPARRIFSISFDDFSTTATS
jgi:hypothetical protein